MLASLRNVTTTGSMPSLGPGHGRQGRELGHGEVRRSTGDAVPQAHEVGADRGQQVDLLACRRPADLEHRHSPSSEAMRLYWISVVPE